MKKTHAEEVRQLQFDFYSIRKDAFHFFGDIPEKLIVHRDVEFSYLALAVGKFLAWHAPKLDAHSKPIDDGLPIKIPSAFSLAEKIRVASINSLEGKNIDVCNREYSAGLSGVNARLDKLTAILAGGEK